MRPFARLACFVLVAALAVLARAEDEPLRALVLQHKDPHTNQLGAKKALAAAGFDVDDLNTKRSASSIKADVIVLGSFSSEAPEWWKYSRSKIDGLQRFVAKGGVLVQFAQNPDVEATPPFLLEGTSAIRHDQHAEVFRVTGEHPLTDGLARFADRPTQLTAQRWRGRHTAWHDLVWWEGMKVLVAAGEDDQHAAVLEAAHGDGRILVTSFILDKAPDKKDVERAKGGDDPQAQFFAGLAAYVRAVRSGTAPQVEPSSPQEAVEPQVGDPVSAPWRLGLSDVVVYVRRPVTKKGGASIPGAAHVFTITGSDLRDRGRYLPADLRRKNLPAFFALRLTDAAAAAETIEMKLELRDVTPVEVTGEVHARLVTDAPEGRRQAWVTGEFAFASKGKSARKDKHRLAEGEASTTALVDLDEGVVIRARADVTYQLVKVDADRGEKPQAVAKRAQWALEAINRARYPEYRDDVAKAIERGVEWLRGDQQDDKTWKPHGGYKVGTTSLSVLTLSACGVPRDDPMIAEPLEWIFSQSPKKTYDRAVALMAIDKVYTPPGETERLRQGGEPGKREIGKKRLAWVHAVAAELERTATQPGSWGYPPKGRVIPNFDTSNTQYAILGLNAASHFGYEPKEGTWIGIMRHFEMVREKDGPAGSVALIEAGKAIRDESKTTHAAIPVREVAGFRYTTLKGPHEVWASMTCAGIASLSIARHQLRRIGSKKLTAQIDGAIEEAINGAWAWIDRNWATDRHPHHPGGDWVYYYLYSLERAAILHGVKRIGGRDWYYEGAAQLLAWQKDKGGWSKTLKRGDDPSVVQTCLALLFLKRATAPLTGR